MVRPDYKMSKALIITVKYGYESKGTRAQERLRWRVPAAYTKQTRPLVREDAHKNRPVIVKD
jgi:hypothetical protein